MTLDEMVKEAYDNSKAHGFHDNEDSLKVIPEKLALIHSEVSEALEDYRSGNGNLMINQTWTEKDKPCGFPSELADIIIRVGDLCGQLDIDLAKAVYDKMKYNRSRPYKHGKKC